MIAFDAEAAAYFRDETINAEMLVLAENADGSGRRLEIQRSLVVSDQDREHGMDTYEPAGFHRARGKTWIRRLPEVHQIVHFDQIPWQHA